MLLVNYFILKKKFADHVINLEKENEETKGMKEINPFPCDEASNPSDKIDEWNRFWDVYKQFLIIS